MSIFDDIFDCQADVARAFDIPPESLDDVEFVWASYTNEDYEGSATVIFIRDGKWYEVHGSHCSCYGLGGQWDPEATSPDVLLARPRLADQAKAAVRARVEAT